MVEINPCCCNYHFHFLKIRKSVQIGNGEILRNWENDRVIQQARLFTTNLKIPVWVVVELPDQVYNIDNVFPTPDTSKVCVTRVTALIKSNQSLNWNSYGRQIQTITFVWFLNKLGRDFKSDETWRDKITNSESLIKCDKHRIYLRADRLNVRVLTPSQRKRIENGRNICIFNAEVPLRGWKCAHVSRSRAETRKTKIPMLL